jgi:hypothetical protein
MSGRSACLHNSQLTNFLFHRILKYPSEYKKKYVYKNVEDTFRWVWTPYDGVFHNPTCFGFYLQRLYESERSFVLTSLSCLLDTKKIAEMLDNNESHQEVMERILSRQDLKSEINQYVVVDPDSYPMKSNWKVGEYPKWNFTGDSNE